MKLSSPHEIQRGMDTFRSRRTAIEGRQRAAPELGWLLFVQGWASFPSCVGTEGLGGVGLRGVRSMQE